MISFKGAQYPKEVILFAVFFYVRYGMSYRGLEEIMHERGVIVDHTPLNRWVTRYSGANAEAAHRRKGPCDRSWRMDETYMKLKGTWVYLYRAVGKYGKTIDFILSQCRNKAINKILKGFGCSIPIEMVRRNYLSNIAEQDHRFIKGRTRLMRGFKAFSSAAALVEIEVAHIIGKGQFTPGICPFRQFAELAA